MEPSIEEIYNLAKIIIDGNQLQGSENQQTLKDTFDELLAVVDATLSLRLDGISLEHFDPHYLEYRTKVRNDFDEVLMLKDNSLQHLREDLTRLHNHLIQADDH